MPRQPTWTEPGGDALRLMHKAESLRDELTSADLAPPDRILLCLALSSAPMGREAIANAIGMKPSGVRHWLPVLEDGGWIAQSERRGWILTSTT